MKRRALITGVLILAGFVWAATVGAMYQSIRRFESTPGRIVARVTQRAGHRRQEI